MKKRKPGTFALAGFLIALCLLAAVFLALPVLSPLPAVSPTAPTSSRRPVSNRDGFVAQPLLPTPTPTPLLSTPYQPMIWQGDSRHAEVALTFDDGPNPPYTRQILHTLLHYRVSATFFCVGEYIRRYPWLVREEHEDGEIVGDHSWNHPELPRLSSSAVYAQLNDTARAIRQVTGVSPAYFRPPYGEYTPAILAQARSLGLTGVMWSIDPRDWARPGVAFIADFVVHYARNGAIILMHDGGGNRSQTVAALPLIIQGLRQRGFRMVTIPQLIYDMGGHVQPSTVAPGSGKHAHRGTPRACRPSSWRYRCLADRNRDSNKGQDPSMPGPGSWPLLSAEPRQLALRV